MHFSGLSGLGGTSFWTICMETRLEKQSVTIEDRFGIIAERKGYTTPVQIVKALEIQVIENIRDGEHRFVGEILLDQGHITRFQINDVLDSIEK